MASVYELAQFSENVYSPGARPVPGWTSALGRLGNPKDGFYAEYFKHTKRAEIVISYRGTDPDQTKDLVSDVQLALGSVPEQFGHAERMFKALKNQLKGHSVYLTGHSLGGGLASLVAAVHGVPVVTFNAPGMKRVLLSMQSGASPASMLASPGIIPMHYATLGMYPGFPGPHKVVQQALSRQQAEKLLKSLDTSKMLNIRASDDLVSVATGPAIGRVASIKVSGWKPSAAKQVPITTADYIMLTINPGSLVAKTTINEASKLGNKVSNAAGYVLYQHGIDHMVAALKKLGQYQMDLGWVRTFSSASTKPGSAAVASVKSSAGRARSGA
ncbi:hypothetical protein BO221_34490 [Archangium sp. Cb G35]|uniref:lipase family protein n=1 Tax=Archangium sp. Cb G35 TaxID=1920190 RepID=UPI00093695AA|nr:Mbeg1-like protein [Archangium sp. Cb G35]OJT19493.1 hypothetical protein BO221_34490 [Archangium sp. Cb G35]